MTDAIADKAADQAAAARTSRAINVAAADDKVHKTVREDHPDGFFILAMLYSNLVKRRFIELSYLTQSNFAHICSIFSRLELI
ncbi:hypothetical protein GCM10010913_29480 [Paenibacillus aceti]|uniref:Uncharacterized protein n=1 Tax=Paenibacillus aceti TaxID=1820010 RepID=A0ABQ1W0X5_9BACL|nr:hypothetical protein GCM10010913_29480 [Paenibacillus aceti]